MSALLIVAGLIHMLTMVCASVYILLEIPWRVVVAVISFLYNMFVWCSFYLLLNIYACMARVRVIISHNVQV